MFTVTLTQDVRPWRAGDDVHLPETVAKTLIDTGEAKDMRPFKPTPEYEDRAMQPGNGRRGYKTKGN